MDQGGSKNGPHGQNGPNGENEHGPNGPKLDLKYKNRPKKMKFPKFNLAKGIHSSLCLVMVMKFFLFM